MQSHREHRHFTCNLFDVSFVFDMIKLLIRCVNFIKPSCKICKVMLVKWYCTSFISHFFLGGLSQLEHVRKRIEDQHKMKIDATVDAIQLLALWGYDPNYGARPVRRVIKQNILPELTQGILKGVLKENDTILIDTQLTANPNQKLSFKRLEAGSPSAAQFDSVSSD